MRSSKGKNWHEHTPASVQDAGYALHERSLALGSRDVRGNAVCALRDENIDLDVFGNRCRDQMTIIFSRVVACKEDLEPGDLDDEHGRTEDVPGRIGGYADGGDGVRGVVVYGFNFRKGVEVVGFGVEICSLVRGRGRCAVMVSSEL